MKTKVVYISGAHGVGKDSIILDLARRLEKAGMSIWVFPEMPYPPDIATGTMDFQVQYKRKMEVREEMIDILRNKGYFDYIICNRHPIDVDIYTSRINGMKVERHPTWIKYDGLEHRILITCPSTIVKDRLKTRLADETWRENWNELDMKYFCDIQAGFKKMSSESWFAPYFVYDYKPYFKEIENIGTIAKAVDQIMEWIY